MPAALRRSGIFRRHLPQLTLASDGLRVRLSRPSAAVRSAEGWSKVFGRLIVGWLEEHRDQVADIDLIIGNPTAPDRVPLQHIETITASAYTEDTLGRWPIADPDSPALIKKHETKKSASGGVQWQDKLQAAQGHAEALKFRRSVESERILLIDDVFTTGATFHTVGKRLMTEGKATEVRGLVLARVPFGA
ncbi:ComF family protein [Streptomyces sp. NPDC002851]